MNKIKQLLAAIDQNIILWLAGFLLAFIPLYPKIPLFSPIESYIVRVRWEDILVLITVIIWFIQLLRKKVSINRRWAQLIALYVGASFLSVLSGALITRTIPLEPLHLGKSLLHFFRYIEYFTLFFILYSAITKKADVYKILGVMGATLLAITIYGFGQRYYYWPVYSTMNREFSKGITLYLTEHARVQSTFAGHYDLGAWLVIVLPLVLAMAFFTTKKWLKLVFHLLHLGGLWLMIESAARSSFAGYLVGVTLVVLFLANQKTKFLAKVFYFITRYLFVGISVILMMVYFGDSLAERLLQAFEPLPGVAQFYQTVGNFKQTIFDPSLSQLTQGLFPTGEKPANGLSTDEAVQIIVSSDTRPSTEKPKDRPSDVYVNVPDLVQVATISATGQTEIITVPQERTYSANALKYGLSFAIRLDTLWPQAWKGFLTNPLFGTGYATLNKNVVYVFTEADGTDNNFLRTLGETGAFGFLSFYGLIIICLGMAIRALRRYRDPLLTVLAIGYSAGSVGLLLNATYIDVYASSKVAFTFWGLTGLFLSYLAIVEKHAQLSHSFVPKIPKPSAQPHRRPTTTTKTFKNATTPKKRRRKTHEI